MIQLNRGDKVAIVSLSAGILGEDFCSHQLKKGVDRLNEFGLEVVFMPNALKGIDFIRDNPAKRAEDLINAFQDNSIKGIICAIGGEDTFKLAPYILTEENQTIIRRNPKFFMGYSDTTINHLMFNKLGLHSFYGLSFLTCFAELGNRMLDYSKKSFENIFTKDHFEYTPSKVWYEEREDFSSNAVGIERTSHVDDKGYELLQGAEKFSGELMGGCVESLYELLAGERYPEQKIINQTYALFPPKEELEGSILFLETSEEKPTPDQLKKMLTTLKDHGLFDKINGLLIGKPQDEVFYDEYKDVMMAVVPPSIPILYNVNFGHAYPKSLLQYGAFAELDYQSQRLTVARL